MSTPDIGYVYSLVRRLAESSAKYSEPELTELDRAKARATSDLSDEIQGLSSWAKRVDGAIDVANDEDVVEALIHLRIHVMDIATAFDNLAGDISLLFERQQFEKMVLDSYPHLSCTGPDCRPSCFGVVAGACRRLRSGEQSALAFQVARGNADAQDANDDEGLQVRLHGAHDEVRIALRIRRRIPA